MYVSGCNENSLKKLHTPVTQGSPREEPGLEAGTGRSIRGDFTPCVMPVRPPPPPAQIHTQNTECGE